MTELDRQTKRVKFTTNQLKAATLENNNAKIVYASGQLYTQVGTLVRCCLETVLEPVNEDLEVNR